METVGWRESGRVAWYLSNFDPPRGLCRVPADIHDQLDLVVVAYVDVDWNQNEDCVAIRRTAGRAGSFEACLRVDSELTVLTIVMATNRRRLPLRFDSKPVFNTGSRSVIRSCCVECVEVQS